MPNPALDLPGPLLSHIMSFLTPGDALNALLVCKSWLAAAVEDGRLWADARLNGDNEELLAGASAKRALHTGFMARAPCLRSLHITGSVEAFAAQLAGLLRSASGRSPLLQRLKLDVRLTRHKQYNACGEVGPAHVCAYFTIGLPLLF